MRSLIKFCIKILSYFLFLLPRSWVRALGSFIGFLWIDLLRVRRDVVFGNLAIAFPEWSEKERIRVGRESVYNMGRGFFEFFTVPHLNQKWLQNEVVFEGQENLKKALEKGKGILALSLHLGNGDLASTAIVMSGQPVTIITKVFKNKFINDLWFSFRGAKGVRYIDAHGDKTSFDILKALKRQEAVVFVVDQFMGRPYGIATTFFGKRTGTAYGLALFALKTKAPVVPIYTYEGADKKMHVVFGDEVPVLDLVTEDKDATILAITQRFNDKIEEIVRSHPEQWMWVHRRWKDF
ncbi:lysophospholipid acyltransferase family protein [Bdellovibrio sp. HCB337]|uniref:lysophospholipid acyltransferase family protein n=1 Tax=Bdellovibrio sp. HCB337 TaxID=3394358 RepID=UPI0039A4F96E